MFPDKFITDARGRKLLVHEMDPADQLDLFEACAKNSTNSSWVSMALLVCSCRQIDDKPVPMPMNPAAVKSLARELGHDGITAIGQALNADDSGNTMDVDLAKN